MSEIVLLVVVISICFVFVGSFIATLFIPDYQGAAVFAPVMTAVGGAALGIALSRRSNGKGEA